MNASHRKVRRIGILTGGGDCPGLNAVIRVVTKAAISRLGLEVIGIEDGFLGLIRNRMRPLTYDDVSNILTVGGTILGTTNKADPSRFVVGEDAEGRPIVQDVTDRVIEHIHERGIDVLICIGGDGTMTGASRLIERGVPCIGVPKTIDNDVGDSKFQLIDHTPGYGSTARYWSHAVQLANEENCGSSPADPVLVLQAMGRRIGFIPAAARLADPDRKLPLQIYLAEREISIEQLSDNVNDLLRREGRAILVVSEGLKLGSIGERKDSFGHTQFSSSETTVAQMVINALNQRGLPVKGAARANVPGTDQRHNMVYASTVDLEEAYAVGQEAATLAAAGESGYMATILRNAGPGYSVRYDKVPLPEVANSERAFPAEWITADGTDVTDEFVKYARPLVGEDWVSVPMIGGRLRLAQLRPRFADQKLPKYVPQADRK